MMRLFMAMAGVGKSRLREWRGEGNTRVVETFQSKVPSKE